MNNIGVEGEYLVDEINLNGKGNRRGIESEYLVDKDLFRVIILVLKGESQSERH